MKKILFYTLLMLSTISCKKEIKERIPSPDAPTSNHLMYNEHKICSSTGFNTYRLTGYGVNFLELDDQLSLELYPYSTNTINIKLKGNIVKHIANLGAGGVEYEYFITTDGISSYLYKVRFEQIIQILTIENIVVSDAESYFISSSGKAFIFFAGSKSPNHPLGRGSILGMVDLPGFNIIPLLNNLPSNLTDKFIDLGDLAGRFNANKLIACTNNGCIDVQITSVDSLGFTAKFNQLFEIPIPANSAVSNNMCSMKNNGGWVIFYGVNNFDNTKITVRNKPVIYKYNLLTNVLEWQSDVHANDNPYGTEYYYDQVLYKGSKILAAGVAVPRNKYLGDNNEAFGNAFIDVIDSNTGELLRTHTFGNVNYRSRIKNMDETSFDAYPMLRCVGYTDLYYFNDSLNMKNTNNWFSTGDHSCAWQFDVNIDEL